MEHKIIFACYFLIWTVSYEAARILAVFPFPSISHQVVFRPLTQELAKRGHEVVVVTTDPAVLEGNVIGNLTEINIHDISYEHWHKTVALVSKGKKSTIEVQIIVLDFMTNIFESQLRSKEIQELLRSYKGFDLLFVEALVRPALCFSYVYKAPVIQISSFGGWYDSFEVVGAPVHPLIYPQIFRQKLSDLTFWDKITELYNHVKFKRAFNDHEEIENEMLKRVFGPDVPSVSELYNDVNMLFLNVHPIWENNRPVPPAVIYMGGLPDKPNKTLPDDLKEYLDASTDGVIYMSFGTNVQPSLLSPDKIQMFVRVFSQLPYNVLWKWDNEVLLGKPKNIRISKWFPQSDLLRHPNVKLFITQGGLQSTDEAIKAGVPLIGFPILGDQWYNVEKYVQHQIGLRLDLETVTEQKFSNAVTTILGDERYKSNIQRLRTLMHDQPQSPLERAVWWTEHVLRHSGARHLRAPAANISWTEYYMLDILIPILVAATIAALLMCVMLFRFVCYVFCKNINKLKVN